MESFCYLKSDAYEKVRIHSKRFVYIVKGKVESVCEIDRDNDFSITTDQHPFIRLSEVKPIPLTSEILKKNGWKLHKYYKMNDYYDVSWSGYHKPAETNESSILVSLIFLIRLIRK